MSELMHLLTMPKPFPIPAGLARVQSFDDEADSVYPTYCPKCEQTLSDEAFYVRPDGRLSSWCKCCTRENSRDKRQAKKGVQE